jgi:predicted AAA+ superfamily ATPase
VAFNTVHQWVLALSRLYFLFEIRPFAGRLSRSLRREGKIYLYDYTEIESPGARFENLVALHLLKLVDAWNDWGYGDFSLHYVRNKEKKEVDFLVMEGKHPHLLLETKSSDIDLSPALVYFRDRLNPKFTLQLVQKPGVFKGSDKEKTWILSADRFLAGI